MKADIFITIKLDYNGDKNKIFHKSISLSNKKRNLTMIGIDKDILHSIRKFATEFVNEIRLFIKEERKRRKNE